MDRCPWIEVVEGLWPGCNLHRAFLESQQTTVKPRTQKSSKAYLKPKPIHADQPHFQFNDLFSKWPLSCHVAGCGQNIRCGMVVGKQGLDESGNGWRPKQQLCDKSWQPAKSRMGAALFPRRPSSEQFNVGRQLLSPLLRHRALRWDFLLWSKSIWGWGGRKAWGLWQLTLDPGHGGIVSLAALQPPSIGASSTWCLCLSILATALGFPPWMTSLPLGFRVSA